MRGRRTWWAKTVRIAGAKLAIALALAIPDSLQRPANYWLLDAIPGLEAGAAVAVSGVVVGRVVAKKERGDTTFLKVVFTAEMNRLPRERILWLQRVGSEGLVALEIASAHGRNSGSVGRGGRVRVIFETPLNQSPPLGRDPLLPDELSAPPLWRPLPSGPPASLRAPLLST